jgi:hypothetical protein
VQSKNGTSERLNWREYNESLVKHGEMYLTFDLLESWDSDLEKLNRDKPGRKYASPGPLLELRMMHLVSRLPFTQIEGFLGRLWDLIPAIKIADYKDTCRRGANLVVRSQDTISSSLEPIVISTDCTGIKMPFEIFEGLCLMGTIFSLARGNQDRTHRHNGCSLRKERA